MLFGHESHFHLVLDVFHAHAVAELEMVEHALYVVGAYGGVY